MDVRFPFLVVPFLLLAGCTQHGPVTQHRAAAAACTPSPLSAPPLACATDADCTPASGVTRFCVAGACSFDQCLSDADCPSEEACTCSGTTFGWSHVSNGARCVPAGCHVDADCGDGGACSWTTTPMGSFYGVSGLYCHTSMDSCGSDADCGGDGSWNTPYCAYSARHWSCFMGSGAG